MEAYETCVSSLRKTQAQRRNMSLNRISPANFTKEVMILFFFRWSQLQFLRVLTSFGKMRM